MPKFKYQAVTPEGVKEKGILEGITPGGVKQMLLERDLRQINIKEHKSLMQLELTKKKVPKAELMHLSRQLAAFIRAGVPILEAIEVISAEAPNKRLQEVLGQIGDALKAGETFAQAVSVHADVFPHYYMSSLRSAELTGHLDGVLDQLAKYIERDLESRRKIRSALIYPAMIFAMSLVTVGILTGFVLPRFETFFESLNAKLPLPTRMLLGAGEFVTKWWWAILLSVGLLSLVIGAWQKTARGRRVRHRFILKVPALGGVVRYAIVERFCRMMSSMVQAGVPLPDAMSVAAEGTNNITYQAALVEVRDAMMRGEGLARPLADAEMFPGSIIQMIKVGENTGTLDHQLETAASFYEQELDYKLKKFTSLFEPLVIVVMGLLVGFVAIALVSAMYGIFSQAGTIVG